MDRRILVWTGQSKIPLVFQDWQEFLAYLIQEGEAGRSVIIHKWEYA